MRILILILLLPLLHACNDMDGFRIDGTLDEKTGSSVYLEFQDVNSTKIIDSCRLKRNNSFHFKSELEIPAFFNLRLGQRNSIPLLIAPGEKIHLQTNIRNFSTDYTIQGSEGSSYIKDLNSQLLQSRSKIDSLMKIYNTTEDEDLIEELNKEYQEIIISQRRYSLDFILKHPTSLASLYAIYQKIDDENWVLNSNRDIQIMKITAASLDTVYPESGHVKSLVRNAADLEGRIKMAIMARNASADETSFPEIKLPDPQGDSLALSSLLGNVIILYFWASWDATSIGYNLRMKDLYDKYHSRGLEIYQVSFDYDQEKWKEAIRFDELNWNHVSELTYPNSKIAALYNVESLPTYYLIDRKGEILGKNISIAKLDQQINELL